MLAVGVLLMTGMPAWVKGADSYRSFEERQCPILDTPYRTFRGLELGYVAPAGSLTAGWNDMSMMEVSAWGRVLSWENEVGGELEIRGHWDSMLLQFSDVPSGMDSSYGLSMGRIFMQWSQRFLNGWGLQMDVSPGLYSGLEQVGGDDFSAPAGLTLIKAFTPNVALFAGVSLYPTFDQTVDPRVGLRWSRRDDVVLQLAYPESRYEVSPSKSLRLHLGARLWIWPEYQLGDEDPRERLQYDEGRVYGGIEWAFNRWTELSLQGGYVFNRTMAFEASSPDVELDDAPFVRIGFTGRL